MQNKYYIQRIKSLLSKDIPNKDLKVSKRLIFNKLVTTRGTLIIQQANKRQPIATEAFQLLPCIEMEKASISQCECIPPYLLVGRGNVYRSVQKIPRIIRSNFNLLIKDISTVLGNNRLDIEEYSSLKYYKGRKFGINKPFVFFFDDYLYAINCEFKVLTMRAVFHNPLEPYLFSLCGCNEVDDCISHEDRDFHIPSYLEEPLLLLTKQEIFPTQGIAPEQQEEVE